MRLNVACYYQGKNVFRGDRETTAASFIFIWADWTFSPFLPSPLSPPARFYFSNGRKASVNRLCGKECPSPWKRDRLMSEFLTNRRTTGKERSNFVSIVSLAIDKKPNGRYDRYVDTASSPWHRSLMKQALALARPSTRNPD